MPEIHQDWTDLLERAVFELDPAKLAQSITAAHEAIRARLGEVNDCEDSEKERLVSGLKLLKELSDVLQNRRKNAA